MKQITTLIFLMIWNGVWGQTPLLDATKKLIEEKKYETAFNKLQEADPKNDDPDILVEKTDLVLRYFVSSIMHKLFAITDLESDEDISEIRGSEGSFSMIMFDPDSLLTRLIAKYPTKYELRKMRGYYFHEVHMKYGTNCELSEKEVIDAFLENYLEAFSNGVYDDWSAYGIGYAYVSSSEYKKSIPFFEKSIELKQDYPSSHYNLAIAYLYSDMKEKAISSAKTAMQLYQEPNLKGDAARVIAVIYEELQNNEKALEYYKKANQIDSKNYYTLKPLLATSLKLNTDNYSDLLNEFFLLAPTNPTIYQDLITIYSELNREEELEKFLKSKQTGFATDSKIMGNLHFFRGVVLLDLKLTEESNSEFKNARREFAKIFESTHDVFKTIDSYLNHESGESN
ncbi:MAG: tetratricopeptide repeat protein [Flavobacteriales bacterium]|nr:tetratricopeptide repeat protein [Flavobacteriales bacterium]